MFQNKNIILFDLDGTIIDSKEGISSCLIETLEHFGFEPPQKDQLDWCIGPPLHKSYEILSGSNDPDLIRQLVQHNREIYRDKWMYDCKVFPGIKEALESLMCDKTLYIATSKPRVFAEEIVDHLGLRQYFQKIYGSELDGRAEDKTELISDIIRAENIIKQNAVLVGDRKYDIEGAKNNDIEVIAVKWGFAEEDEFIKYKPTYICKHVDLLTSLFF